MEVPDYPPPSQLKQARRRSCGVDLLRHHGTGDPSVGFQPNPNVPGHAVLKLHLVNIPTGWAGHFEHHRLHDPEPVNPGAR